MNEYSFSLFSLSTAWIIWLFARLTFKGRQWVSNKTHSQSLANLTTPCICVYVSMKYKEEDRPFVYCLRLYFSWRFQLAIRNHPTKKLSIILYQMLMDGNLSWKDTEGYSLEFALCISNSFIWHVEQCIDTILHFCTRQMSLTEPLEMSRAKNMDICEFWVSEKRSIFPLLVQSLLFQGRDTWSNRYTSTAQILIEKKMKKCKRHLYRKRKSF